MAIALVGSVTTNSTGAGGGVSSITCNYPAGIAPGHLVLWQIVGTTATIPSTDPSGFTQWRAPASTTAVNSAVYYRKIDGTEGASATSGTLTLTRHSTLMVAFSGVDLTVLDDVASSATNGTTATTFGAITPVTPGAWIVAFGAQQFASGTAPGTLATTNLSNLTQVNTTAAAASNALAGFGSNTWASGAFTPNMSNSAATARTIGIRGALRPRLTRPSVGIINPASTRSATR